VDKEKEKEESYLKKSHQAEGRQKIDRLDRRINTTRHNIEASKEITETPYEAQSEKLSERNVQRRHAIGSMQKEIRDIGQTMEDRSKEKPT